MSVSRDPIVSPDAPKRTDETIARDVVSEAVRKCSWHWVDALLRHAARGTTGWRPSVPSQIVVGDRSGGVAVLEG